MPTFTVPAQDAAVAYDEIVRQDIESFRGYINQLLAGELTDDEFRQHRLRRGIYGQRQPGVQMVRTKIPGGIATAEQFDVFAEIADKFAGGKGHLTTRQNIQYHFVPLAQVPDLLHRLADVRLTTREACYNTVRNITACPLAGLCPQEVFDVNPYARRLAFAFLHQDITDNLPRKFKIAFSGCAHDCMLGSIHDVGLQPVIRDGQRGFRMVVAGGLGPLPTEAQLLDEFVPEDQLVHKCEAVIRVFSQHGNRKNRNKARLKFVMRERGFDWLKETIEREYQGILTNGGIPMPDEVPENFAGFQRVAPPIGDGSLLPILSQQSQDPIYDAWLESNTREQKQTGYAVVTVRINQGNLTGDQMRGLAQIARTAGDSRIRLDIDQNVLLGNVALGLLPRVYAALRMIGLGEAGAREIDDVVTCPGAYSCNLALTKSMNLGDELAHVVAKEKDDLIRRMSIRISGCPNSCGQHWSGDFGFYGNARKINGVEVPYYQMLLGGGTDRDGNMKFGLAIQSIPARLAPEALTRVIKHYRENRTEGETFREYVLRYKIETFRGLTADLAKPAELYPELYQDWGDDVAFSLQLGRGECAS